MRIAHVITDFETGGAQVMLRRLVMRLQADGVDNSVISLSAPSPRFDDLRPLGVDLHHLDMRSRFTSVGAFVRLRRRLAALRPDVVHTWLYHADLVGGLAAGLTGLAPVVWGIHHTAQQSERLKPMTRLVRRVNGVLSPFLPARIVCCAHAAEASHRAIGYPRGKMMVIANGFDTEAFRPDLAARRAIRRELEVPADAPLVGLMARFHPQKDHHTFVRAAARLMRQIPDAHFVLAGRGVTRGNRALRRWIEVTGAPRRFHVLGQRDDMPRLMAACDVVSMSSACGEGLPLVLGEAMACGVPCVATDVGDSALLVGETGRVVPPGDADALAAAWASLLALAPEARQRLGQRARDRVLARYQLASCVRAHLALYRQLSRPLAGERRTRPAW
jgi:glycosyltransferase involved in cell wall biosynthesis